VAIPWQQVSAGRVWELACALLCCAMRCRVVVQHCARAHESRLIASLFAGTLLGPLHTKAAVKEYTDGLAEILKQGGRILAGGSVVPGEGNFVQATIVEIDPSAPIVKTELFVPILYVMKFKVRCSVSAECLDVLYGRHVYYAGVRRPSRRRWR
jgi:acyl-CoA reductase-like NAD-dependent aldehyde dehydrogenase